MKVLVCGHERKEGRRKENGKKEVRSGERERKREREREVVDRERKEGNNLLIQGMASSKGSLWVNISESAHVHGGRDPSQTYIF
jgi:hypothetical protein